MGIAFQCFSSIIVTYIEPHFGWSNNVALGYFEISKLSAIPFNSYQQQSLARLLIESRNWHLNYVTHCLERVGWGFKVVSTYSDIASLMRKGYRNRVTLQVWALNAVYVMYNCAKLQGKPISFQLGNGWLENWVDYICGTFYSSDLWLASSIRQRIFGFSKCHMLMHSYRICLLFSHCEAVLIPADKHVIYIFCF